MKQTSSNNSEIRAEQVTNILPEAIYLGLDLHKMSIALTRIIDHSTPQPAQKFAWDRFWAFAQKQTGLAKKVYAVYEAGAFGFWVARKLQSLGIECYVVHPEKLDPQHKRVQTDQLDSRNLADKLQRYVLGNKRAMVSVYIPSQRQEEQRLESRHRRSLHKQLTSLQRRGASLLLSQGIFQTHGWWRKVNWERLEGKICAEMHAALSDDLEVIAVLEQKLKAVEKKLTQSAPKELPKGFGALTFVILMREICTYERFKSRRNLGGFTGLGGAVSSSGPYHLDLSISKAGSSFLRTQLVELAWRMIYWQPRYQGLKIWNQMQQGIGLLSKRRRKIAVVAAARQLAVDIWKWQTGRVTPEQLGWQMVAAK